MNGCFTQGRRGAVRTLGLAAIAALAMHMGAAQAQDFPVRPVQLVVGYSPGGALDVMARIVAQRMTETLGQPVVVENRAGANAGLAAEYVARAAPDGYTLVVATPGIESVNPYIYKSTTFDPQRDLAAVGALGSVKLFLTTRKGLAVADTKALVAYAKANPGRLTYGSAGAGSTTHLVGELFKASAGISAVHIPYKGAAATLQDLLAEQIDFLFDPGLAAQHARLGKVKLLAVASATRSSLFPDVPTLNELGYRNMDWDTWVGVYAPAKTPAAIVNLLNSAMQKALTQATVQQRFRDIGAEAAPTTPAQFKEIARRETAAFKPLILSQKIRAD